MGGGIEGVLRPAEGAGGREGVEVVCMGGEVAGLGFDLGEEEGERLRGEDLGRGLRAGRERVREEEEGERVCECEERERDREWERVRE